MTTPTSRSWLSQVYRQTSGLAGQPLLASLDHPALGVVRVAHVTRTARPTGRSVPGERCKLRGLPGPALLPLALREVARRVVRVALRPHRRLYPGDAAGAVDVDDTVTAQEVVDRTDRSIRPVAVGPVLHLPRLNRAREVSRSQGL
ncbi:hypothetical protein ACRJ4W_33190 [Streptomyces sp. GLT-R25]